jgi:uncharacterized protein YajQ (UPF0234 family)
MPAEFSFDVVSEVDLNIVGECVHVAMKEISNRFDFKGSVVSIELNAREKTLSVRAEDDYKINAATDVLYTRMAKRGLPLKNFTKGKVETALGQTARMPISVAMGIPSDKAKEMVASIKQTKLKVNASIQGEQVRVSSKSKDQLQAAIALLKGGNFGLELQFKNFR